MTYYRCIVYLYSENTIHTIVFSCLFSCPEGEQQDDGQHYVKVLFFSSNDIFIFLYFIFHYIDVLFDVCLFVHLINDFLFSLFFLVVL